MNIIISAITSASEKYPQVFRLRDEILRKPLGMSLVNDDLSRDHTDTIFIAEHNEEVIGCVLLHHLSAEEAQLRAMAVYDKWQGQVVGRMLVEALENFSSEKGYSKIILHARKVVLGFYSGMGYSVTGDEFTEVGIPHYMMEKSLPGNK